MQTEQPPIPDHEPEPENLPEIPEEDTGAPAELTPLQQTEAEAAARDALAAQEHGQVDVSKLAGLKPTPVNVHINEDGSARIKPIEETPETEEERLAKDQRRATQAFEKRVADKQAELDKLQPEQAQVVKIRAGINSHRIGLVIQRKNGDYIAEQLGHRALTEITLELGDSLMIAPLGTDTLRDFMRMADMAPAVGNGESA